MKILDILKKAEEDLREAIAEAAHAGDYHAVDIGREAALEIKNLCELISGNETQPTKLSGDNEEITKRKEHKKGKPEGYPKIEIRKSSLYRIGWSRKKKDKYEHNVPRTAFETVVNTMSALAREGGGPFMAEKIIGKINATKEDAIPAYQVYVVLAALCEWNLLAKIGREGYKIPMDIAVKANNKWAELINKN